MRSPMWKPAPRSALTTIPCAQCRKPLLVRRVCRSVSLFCEHCNGEYSLREHIKDMDSALEKFLESIHCDRI
jgi:hypothetical protein